MDKKILDLLFELATKSYENDEFPVSAIIYDETGEIIATGYNRRNESKVTTDHAEIIAIQEANKRLGDWRLTNKRMVVTLEPCEMCKRVIKESRLDKVYYLVPRLEYKKQYKCTQFQNLEIIDENVEIYKQHISDFFENKR